MKRLHCIDRRVEYSRSYGGRKATTSKSKNRRKRRIERRRKGSKCRRKGSDEEIILKGESSSDFEKNLDVQVNKGSIEGNKATNDVVKVVKKNEKTVEKTSKDEVGDASLNEEVTGESGSLVL